MFIYLIFISFKIIIFFIRNFVTALSIIDENTFATGDEDGVVNGKNK